MMSQHLRCTLTGGIVSLVVVLGWAFPGAALDADRLQELLSQPPRLQWLDPEAEVPDYVVTPYTTSATDMTIPSLWWMQDQFGGDLLTSWIAAPGLDELPPHVDLVVNESVWRNYSYWERYAFVTLFGRESQQFGYITRVFNAQRPQPRALAIYLCTPIVPLEEQEQQEELDTVVPNCQVYMDFVGVGAPTNFEERFRAF